MMICMNTKVSLIKRNPYFSYGEKPNPDNFTACLKRHGSVCSLGQENFSEARA